MAPSDDPQADEPQDTADEHTVTPGKHTAPPHVRPAERTSAPCSEAGRRNDSTETSPGPTQQSPGSPTHHPGLGVQVSAGANRGGTPFRRGVVSFVRRSPRMNVSQQKALDRLSDRYLVDVPRDTTSTSVAAGSTLDVAEIFGRTAPLTVEIGSGSGDTLAAVAAAHPDRDFIGFEVYLPSIATTLNKLADKDVSNARVIMADAAAGLEHLFVAGQLDEVWTFFPDPWRKKRHHKRRIVNPDTIDLVTSRVHPGGLWRLATDWQDYADWMLDLLGHDDRLEPVGAQPGPRWTERPLTRYENKGVTSGRVVHDFTWRVRTVESAS